MSLRDAVLGGTVQVPTLDGVAEVSVRCAPRPFWEAGGFVVARLTRKYVLSGRDGACQIKPGTQPGDGQRMRGKGIRDVNTGTIGHQFITFKLTLPK